MASRNAQIAMPAGFPLFEGPVVVAQTIPRLRWPGWVIAALVWIALPNPALAQAPLPVVSLVLTPSEILRPGLLTTQISENGTVTVTATMDRASSATVTVTIAVAPANYNAPGEFATADDYVVSDNKVLTFAPGSLASTGVVTITGVDDGGVTRTLRRIRISPTASSNARMELAFVEFFIQDDDPHPTKSAVLTPAAISEKGGVATVTAELSHPTLLGDVLFDVQTGLYPEGTPGRADASDFELSDNVRLVVSKGQTLSTGTVTVTAVDNDVVGPAQKRMGVRLHNVDRQNGPTEPGRFSPWTLLTINEDDKAPVSLSVSPNPVAEGQSTTVTAEVSAALPGDVTIPLVLTAGTAEPDDYGTLASITITGGQTTGTGTITTADDDDGDDETFTVALGALPSQLTPGTPSSVEVTIEDGDEAALVIDPTALEVAKGAEASYAVKLATEPTSAVTVTITGHSGTDLTPSKTSLEFTTPTWNIPQTVTVRAGQDFETATLTHSASGGGYDSLTADVEVTVAEDDRSDGNGRRVALPSVAIWTDRLELPLDEPVRLFWDIDPRGDEREYTVFLCLESIDTGVRRYLVPSSGELREAVVDQYGADAEVRRARSLERVEREFAWEGRVPHAGLWHFVLEVRSPGTAQVLRRAYAKFVVPQRGLRLLNRAGTVRTLAEDTRWSSDWVYSLQDRLVVRSGVTLTIEAGTLIKAWGPTAAIIVEPGGRIVVRGRREAPVVMTCSLPVGERFPGCWGGLVIHGDGARQGGPATERGGLLEAGAAARSGNGQGPASELRFLRVEFAGSPLRKGQRPAALAFVGVGSRAVIDCVQVHASAGDGIAFRGGEVHCRHCVASEAKQASVSWSQGWKGSAQYLYVQQGSHGASGIRGSAEGADSPVAPTLYNATLVGGYNISVPGGAPGNSRTIGPGILLEGGAAITARNLLVTGFARFAIDAPAGGFEAGTNSLAGTVLYSNRFWRRGRGQIPAWLKPWMDYVSQDPDLLNIRYEANPDPRPRSGSPALRLGNGKMPPFDPRFARDGHFVGAFRNNNWLEEWTFFGPEGDYEVPVD